MKSRNCINAAIINLFFSDRHWSINTFSDCNHKLSLCCSLFNQMHWRMFADSPRWSWELAVLCLCLDHEKQQTHTQTWKSVLQSINWIIILKLRKSVRHIKANIPHGRMSMLSRTSEEGGLQQRRGESSLVKKLHQSHVLQLVTQRHWRHKEKQISDDRDQKRERERERERRRCWSSQQHWNIYIKQQACSEFVHTWLDEAFPFLPPLPRSSSSPMAATPHDPTRTCDTS